MHLSKRIFLKSCAAALISLVAASVSNSKKKKTIVEKLSKEIEQSRDFELWEPYWGYERPQSHRRPAGYVKEQ